MLIRIETLRRIVEGDVDLQFRRWQKPTVKVGGRLRTALGELSIVAVDVVTPDEITDIDSRRAGYADASALVEDLFRERRSTGRARTAKPTEASVLYRVQVEFAGEDQRLARRNDLPVGEELDALVARVTGMDARSKRGPWTRRTLTLIQEWPGRRAPELAEIEGLDTLVFKTDVRKLKELGLTESLAVGYRLAPRGEYLLQVLAERDTTVG